MIKREAHWVHDDKGGYWQIPVGGEPYNFRTPPGFVMYPKGEAVTDAEILWDMRHIDDHLKYSEDAASMLIQGVRRVLRRVMRPTEAQAQGGGEVVYIGAWAFDQLMSNKYVSCQLDTHGRATYFDGRPPVRLCAAPPSAPVGVELLCQVYADAYHAGHHATVEGRYVDVLPVDRDTYWREKVEDDYADELAQQPAAVGGADAQDAEIEALRADRDSFKQQAEHNLSLAERLAEALRGALDAVRDTLQQSYQNAGQECCGRGGLQECCGEPEPAWTPDDQAVMDKLGPIERLLSFALRDHDQEVGNG